MIRSTNYLTNWFLILLSFSFLPQTAIFTIFVVPFRLLIITSLLIVAWALATIGLWGLTMQDLNTKPISGWRRWNFFFLSHFVDFFLLTHWVGNMSFSQTQSQISHYIRVTLNNESMMINVQNNDFVREIDLYWYLFFWKKKKTSKNST